MERQVFQFQESEFKVCEDTAKWLRLLIRFGDLWDELLAKDENPDEDKGFHGLYDSFKAIEDQIYSGVNASINESINWKINDKNVI